MISKKQSKQRTSFIVLLTAVVLLFCFAVGTVFAWLMFEDDYDNSDNPTELGLIEVELYSNGVKVTPTTTTDANGIESKEYTSPFVLDTISTSKAVNVTLRNTGTINALVRATINIYFLDTNNNQVTVLTSATPTDMTNTMSVALNHPDWIDALAPSVASGHLFYNKQLNPYVIDGANVTANEIKIVSNVAVPDTQKSRQLYLTITVDAIAYAGNIYKKVKNGETGAEEIPVSAYPFGESVPANWNAYWLEEE